jgi:hypothetical protein
MASWIDDLRSRCGPLSDAASMFAADLGVEHDPPAGAAGLLALARRVERHIDGVAREDEDERLFIELAGAYLSVLLCDALPHGRHVRRKGRHGIALGRSGFFDPFAAIERLLQASDVRTCLLEQVALAEDEARSGPRDPWLQARRRVLPRLVGNALLAEVGRRAGQQPLYSRPLASDVILVFLLSEQQRRRYVDARELASWRQEPDRVMAAALDNLAARSGAARLLRVDAEQGTLIVARTEDGLDSSRVLLPGVRALLAAELGWPFAVAIPHRDALLACAVHDQASVSLLREHAAFEARRARSAITSELLRVDAGGAFAPLDG